MDTAARIVETHISTLVFLDDVVLKRKKPIRTAFVDFSTPDARAAACRTEVELNRRLAPDVYLGVATVTLDRLDGTGPSGPLDHAVVMRRLPVHRRLAAILDTAEVTDELRRLAHLLATFHASARRGPDIDDASGAGAVARLWDEGLAQVAELGTGILDPAEVELVAHLAGEYVAGRATLLDERVGAGRAVDGHGDLQADDVFCLPDGPRVLDCIEFDDRFRFCDVLGDVAFLAMDLERLGRPDLATAFLDHYRELAADSWPESLAHMWIAYRAHIRAKVTCLASRQLDDAGDPDGAAAAAHGALSMHALAARHLLDGRVHLVVVGGGPGTGKSTVARAVAAELGAVALSSDRVRDELAPRGGGRDGGGRDSGDRDGGGRGADDPDSGRYTPGKVDEIYDEMLRRAEVALVRGESVVLDATWLQAPRRERVRRLASNTRSHLVELRCECPPELAEERIRARAAVGTDSSEATVAVARSMAVTATPWPEAVVVDTSAPPEESAARAVETVRGAGTLR